MAGIVHVIGAGLSGLAAAEASSRAGSQVIVHEASPQAGGRCRSYFDPVLHMVIDNGNHLLLSGNETALDYVRRIGGEAALSMEEDCAFDFADLSTGERWTLRPNAGRIPTWILDPRRRVPNTRARDYFAPLRLFGAERDVTLGERMVSEGPVYERLWRPLLIAGLNTEPRDASARLAAALFRETLALGGRACRPVIATGGLGAALVDPALATLRSRGTEVRFGAALKAIETEARAVTRLCFAGADEPIGPDDRVVLAVPPIAAAGLIEGLVVPDRFSAILNIHFIADPFPGPFPGPQPGPGDPKLIGIVGGISEWLFAFPGRLSVTISAADRLLDRPREALAAAVWQEVAALTGRAAALPRWQMVRERRATFLATPEQEMRRPGPVTALDNLFLAGDFTATGLPATIEGAIRSGRRAAKLALAAPARVRQNSARSLRDHS